MIIMRHGSLARGLVLSVCLLWPVLSFADTHCVRQGAAGNGSGADWVDAHPSLPSTLVRGDTYYLADGSYGAHTFNDATSGSTPITIVKATAAAHGPDGGWDDAYGDGQAVFTHWDVYTDYYVFDGAVRDADWRRGAVNQYGIRVAGTGPLRLDDGAGQGGDHLTFRFVDVAGGGRDTGDGDDVVYGLTGNSDVTFQSCALHDSDRTIFLMRGNWTSLTVDHSYLARNTSTPAVHGELLSMTDSDGVVFSHNVIEDIEGTAVFAGLNDGVASNWKIFGNVVLYTPDYVANARGDGHNYGIAAFVYVANDASNDNTGNNFLVHNNTFYNMQGLWSGVFIEQGSGNVVRNNVWHGCVRTNNSGVSADTNWYFETIADGDSSGSSVTCTSACDIFVDAAQKDFHLAVATAAGAALPSPFDVDPDGRLRGADGTWDRGAFELGVIVVTDAGVAEDAGLAEDAGVAADGGLGVDGSTVADGGSPHDAAADGSSPPASVSDCSCRLGGTARPTAFLWLAAAALARLLRARRRS